MAAELRYDVADVNVTRAIYANAARSVKTRGDSGASDGGHLPLGRNLPDRAVARIRDAGSSCVTPSMTRSESNPEQTDVSKPSYI
jgi:hypothetical protein